MLPYVCFISHSRIVRFISYGDVTIAREGLQKFGQFFAPTASEHARRNLYRLTSAVTRGFGVCGLL